jgi:hypothetical protein
LRYDLVNEDNDCVMLVSGIKTIMHIQLPNIFFQSIL